MSVSLVSVLYLISAVLFIFALRGLSHPKSARLGNIFGIIGMIIAVFTTLVMKNVLKNAIFFSDFADGAGATPGIYPPYKSGGELVKKVRLRKVKLKDIII